MKCTEMNFKRQASILNAQIHTHSDRVLIEFPAQVLQQVKTSNLEIQATGSWARQVGQVGGASGASGAGQVKTSNLEIQATGSWAYKDSDKRFFSARQLFAK